MFVPAHLKLYYRQPLFARSYHISDGGLHGFLEILKTYVNVNQRVARHLVEESDDGDGGRHARAGGKQLQQQPQVPVIVVDIVQVPQHLPVDIQIDIDRSCRYLDI